MKAILLTMFLIYSGFSMAQGNCLIYSEDSGERKACEISYKALEYKQGSPKSQLLFDSAIAVGPNYPYAYYEKSVPFFKRGMLNEGILLLNKAIELDPLSYLTYRAYWFFQHESFEQCIFDLERYYAMKGSYQAYTPGGGMDMRLILGISYARIGNLDKGVAAIKQGITEYQSEDFIGLHDYHSLGVLLYENKQYQAAGNAFERQIRLNDRLADTYFYYALSLKEQNDFARAEELLNEAKIRFKGEKKGYGSFLFCYPVYAYDVTKELEVMTAE